MMEVLDYLYPDDALSLCSFDAEGSIYEEAVVSWSTPNDTCRKLPSLSPSSSTKSATKHSVSWDPRLSDSKHTLPSSHYDPPRRSPPSIYHKLDSLEPGRLIKPARGVKVAKTVFPSIDLTPEPIEIDLGGNEQVSNAQLHALELEYQQEQFEQVQRERQLDSLSVDSATVYYAYLHNRPATDMEAITDTAPSPKRAKLMMKDTTIKKKSESVQRRPKEAYIPSSKPKNSSTITLAKRTKAGEDKPTSNTSASIRLEDLPSKILLDGEAADNLLGTLMTKEDAKKLAEENDISISVYKEDVRVSPQIMKVAKTNKAVQTTERDSSDKIIETEKAVIKEYREEEAQVEWTVQDHVDGELFKAAWTVIAFDHAPSQRLLLRQQPSGQLIIDLDLSLQTLKPQKVSFKDVETSYETKVEQDVGIGTKVAKGVDESTMTEEVAMESVEADLHQGDSPCSKCLARQSQLKDEGEAEIVLIPDAKEADAVAALESLFSQKVASLSIQEQEEEKKNDEEELEEGEITEWKQDNTAVGANGPEIDTKDSIGEAADKEDIITILEESEGLAVEVERQAQENMTNPVKKELDPTTPSMSSVRRTRGGPRKTQEPKAEETLRQGEVGEFPLFTRSCRTLRVDYRETGRGAARDRLGEKTMTPIQAEPSSGRSKKRLAEAVQYGEELTSRTRANHPKVNYKENKKIKSRY